MTRDEEYLISIFRFMGFENMKTLVDSVEGVEIESRQRINFLKELLADPNITEEQTHVFNKEIKEKEEQRSIFSHISSYLGRCYLSHPSKRSKETTL